MALYAFDGTWNEDEEAPEQDTNVVHFREYYQAPAELEDYTKGVGTRFGFFGKLVGGLTGAGGRKRVQQMIDEAEAAFAAGHEEIDVVGFSRGSALALHFCNCLRRKGLVNRSGERVTPRIRFLGLWDTVASFGLPMNLLLPFQRINLGWRLGVPENVERCFHALALDERRQMFRPTRLDPDSEHPHIEEVWLRGVHSDVGGGNGNVRRSNIALKWMLERAIACGLPIDANRLAGLEDEIDADAPIRWPKDLVENRKRRVRPGDAFHPTAVPMVLEPGKSRPVCVYAAERFNWTGIHVEPGQRYTFRWEASDTWDDDDITCGADGWKVEDLDRNWFVRRLIHMAEGLRRVPEAEWFELCGTVGEDENHHFRIGNGQYSIAPWPCRQEGVLYLFANDMKSKYDNNKGELRVVIKRVE